MELFESDLNHPEFLDGVFFVSLIWVGMLVSAILVAFFPSLQCISHHGKLHSQINIDKSSSLDNLSCFFASLNVPKKYYPHFYILGSLLSLGFIGYNLIQEKPYRNLGLTLFLLHCLRRTWECYYITDYGNSTMHLGGYLCGLVHYLLVPFTIQFAELERSLTRRFTSQSVVSYGIIFLCFMILNIFQYYAHFILYLNKRKNLRIWKEELASSASISSIDQETLKSKIVYSLPNHWLFQWTACPHYFTEICIYLMLVIIENYSVGMLCLVAWVTTNLSVVAYQQYQFYLTYHFDEVELRNLSVLIPFFW